MTGKNMIPREAGCLSTRATAPRNEVESIDKWSLYALTLKRVKSDRVVYLNELLTYVQDYTEKLNGEYSQVHIEMDTKSVLHAHFILKVPKGTYFKKALRKGWSHTYVPIYDKKGWLRYIKKSVQNQYDLDQLTITHYFRHNYGFEDE